jgi:hypothetical protein
MGFTMQTTQEFAESQIRRFFTVLFTVRAKRHLRTLAEHYGWSAETLATHEARFLRSPPPQFSAGPQQPQQ